MAPAHRCSQNLSGRFGSDAFGLEELVPSFAPFLCAELGSPLSRDLTMRSNPADRLNVLKAAKRTIFTTASKARSATEPCRCLRRR
jgi:antirestriction protein ArdC